MSESQKLDLAIELFAQLYQVLGYHDASEKVMDAVSDAASGDFYEVDLLPYFGAEDGEQ